MVKLLFFKKIKNKLRTIEAQIVQKLKNNEAQPKFTGSYKKRHVVFTSLSQRCHNHSYPSAVTTTAIPALSQPLLSQRCHNHCYPSAVTTTAIPALSQPLLSQRCHCQRRSIAISSIAVTTLRSFSLLQRCAHRCITAVGFLLYSRPYSVFDSVRSPCRFLGSLLPKNCNILDCAMSKERFLFQKKALWKIYEH